MTHSSVLNSPRVVFFLVFVISCEVLSSTVSLGGDKQRNEQAQVALSFEQHIRPILKVHCFQCHGESGVKEGSLDVRLRRFLVKGGDSGAAVEPGSPAESLIVKRIRSGEMPPSDDAKSGDNRHVPNNELRLIEQWIEQGARTLREEPEELSDADLITPEERAFWSFQPIVRHPVPRVENKAQVENPIDAFLLLRLESYGFKFAHRANRATLIRRAYFDLLGLPPTPQAVDRFVADDRPDAWARLVEELLASRQYGERWGRHWLDIAGYSDSEGYSIVDAERPWAWKYRDYVVRAFNSNKPLNEFVEEQLAGDEMVNPPYAELPEEDIDKLIATGFLRMAPDGTTGGKNEGLARNETIAETLKIVSTSLLGLTVGCAQCHDHRYDPIPQADYYRFRAIFEPAFDTTAWKSPRQRLVSLYTKAQQAQAAEIEKQAKAVEAKRLKKQNEFIEATFQKELAKLPEEIRPAIKKARETSAKKRTKQQQELLKKYPSVNVTAGSLYLYDRKAADELKAMTAQATKIRAQKPRQEFVRSLTEVPNATPKTFLFIRGDFEQPKQELQPASLTVLATDGSAQIDSNRQSMPTSGRRLGWAKRLTSGKHPLFARVMANRIWLHHFGKGLVGTPGDFGLLGDRPSHPELLDWLADELMRTEWDVKRLHRLIMTSHAYQQAVQRDSELANQDPDNNLYGAANIKRVEAEVLRDTILSVSGKLDLKPFGVPVPVMADRVGRWVIGKENLNAGRPGPVIDMKGEQFRRTIYIQSRRSRPLTTLDTFDLPRMTPNCDKRNSSTVATQSLLLMNSDFIAEQSRYFAERLRADSTNQQDQLRAAWQLAFSRTATAYELAEAEKFLKDTAAHFASKPVIDSRDKKKQRKRDPDELALTALCQMLLSANEFLYID